MNLYGAYIGSQAAGIVCPALNLTGVTWVREADLGTFADYTPDEAGYAAGTAASIAGMAAALTSQGITTLDTRRIMYDLELYPPTWKYTRGPAGNGVTWAGGYDTNLASGVYNPLVQTAHTLRLDGCKAHAAGARWGDHLTPNRLSMGWAQTAGHYTEPSSFSGAAADLAWWYARIGAIGGCVFGWMYLAKNVDQTTEARIYNYTYNNAKYQIDRAVANGLAASDVVMYTWHYLTGGSVRPTADTLRIMYAALTAAGISHWVVAMGSVTTAGELASANTYLAGAVTEALSAGPADTPADNTIGTVRYGGARMAPHAGTGYRTK